MFDKTTDLKFLLERKNSELLACRAQTHKMLQRSLYGILVVDRNNNVCYANPAAEKIFGSSGEMLLGRPFLFSMIPDKIEEMTIRTHDGRNITVETWSMETEWKNEPAWLVSLQDITERKRNEQELRKMYRAVLDSPVIVVITDALGIIEYVNPRFTEITGYSFTEVIGRSLNEHTSCSADPQTFKKLWETVVTGREWQGEMVGCRKSGELFNEFFSIAPIEDISGVITNFVAIIEDITERKRQEERLRNSERQLAEAQRIAHLGSWKRYVDTGKSHWSDELYRIFGMEPGSIPPANEAFIERVHPDDRNRLLQLVNDAMSRETSFSRHYCRIVRPDGSLRILELNGRVLRQNGGKTPLMVGTALDVTELKQMEEEIENLNATLRKRATVLETSNRELESFSYTVCHDLRSPLTNINGYTQVLTELCSEHMDEQCRSYLHEIRKGTERMNDLIDTLLNFSLLSSRELRVEQVDISLIARETIDELRLGQPERRAEISIADRVTVNADPMLMRIVMQNLLGNAWKYTGSRPVAVIEFGIARTDETTACFVRDNGIGFAAADAKRLFTPFLRLPEADMMKGHGIGLATVQRIIERHGGRVWAEGEPDQGAVFYFTLR